MFGVNKRMVLALMIGLFASSSWGCSTIISHSGHFASELDSPQTRVRVQEKFGGPDEKKTCPGGKAIESRWIRQKIPHFGYPDLGLGGLLLEIVLFPVAAHQSEEAKLHYAFVYDEAGRVLYRYNLKVPPPDQFNMAVKPSALELYRQLKAEKCDTWSSCINDYVKEARQRANCIGYPLGAEEEREFGICLASVSGLIRACYLARMV
jgi:hypothetical protein